MLFGLNRVFRGIIRQRRILAILAVATIGALALFSPAHAMGFVATVLSDIAMVIIELVGKIFIVLIEILLAVVQYNDFINAPAVVKAWVLVRDVANMAFLIIFIAIAFATILGVEKYEYKQLLPKLLIMAVVINFSRTICGIIIDAAQVVMMTFVNGFKDVAAGNLIRGFGVSDMVSLRDFNEGEAGVSDNSIAAASILAVAMLIIAAVTVGIMVIMFLIRVVFLWILIVLSPLAFMLSAAPGMSGKFNEWWSKFTRYVVVGPLLAFFLWLAFSIMASVDPGQNLATQNNIKFGCTHNLVSGEEECDSTASRTSGAITAISRSDNLLSFFIAIALLLLALSTANSIGVAGGKLAGTAMAKIQSGGIKLAKLGALGLATGGAGLAAYGAYRAVGGKETAKTFGKFVGRRVDEKVAPWLTKGVGKAGARIFGKTRLGLAAGKLGEQGVLFRTMKQSWKERAEAREKNITAPYVGTGRDVLHQVIDNKDTNYVFRHVMALANEEAKKQREEGGNTSETFTAPIERVIQSGQVQNTKEIKGAWINTYGNNDENEITLSEAEHHRERDSATGEERVVSIGEEINRRVIANFERTLSKASQDQARAYLQLEEELAQAVERGDSTEDIIAKGEQVKAKMNELKPLGLEYANHLKMKATDSPFARIEAQKMTIGESDEAKQFAARLSGLALENKNYAGFALAGVDPKTGTYEYADVYSEEGFGRYNKTVMGRMRNIPPPDLLRAHPSALRTEVITKDGMRKYGDALNTVGNNLLLLASALLSERNFAPRSDTGTGFIGGVAQREYSGLEDMSSARRSQAREDLAQDVLLGFNTSLGPFMNPESFRAVGQYLQRSGVPEEDFSKTPRELMARHQGKLAREIKSLETVNTALEQATDPVEKQKLIDKIKEMKANIQRLKTQIVRFVENIDKDKMDIPVKPGKSREDSSDSTNESGRQIIAGSGGGGSGRTEEENAKLQAIARQARESRGGGAPPATPPATPTMPTT